jgi:hypothetical protein
MSFPDPNQSTQHIIGSKTWNWDGDKWVLEAKVLDLPNFLSESPVTVHRTTDDVEYGFDPDTVTDELTLP